MTTPSKSHRTCSLLALLLGASFAGACGGGGDAGSQGQLQSAGSVLCPGLTGGEGLAWDVYNGVWRTDPVLPPLPPAGPTYTHPAFPLLGFFHPPTYTPFTTNLGIHEFGVDLVRNDGQVVWREYHKNVIGQVSAVAIRDGEIQGVLGHLGVAGGVQTVCSREGFLPNPGGTVFSAANIMFRVGDFTGIVLVNAVFFQATGSTGTTRKVYVAPTAEFGTRAIDTFLAIDWQMNLGNDAGYKDSDGDGWRDSADIEPFNPNEPTPGGLPR
jgi:hypothetical protein